MSEAIEQELSRLKQKRGCMSVLGPVLFVLLPMAVFLVGKELGFYLGRLNQRISDKYEAVDKGHAELYYDDEGKKQWRWLPPCNPKGARDHAEQ